MNAHNTKGQAMAEFVVIVAGCILLLFVAVPFIAKMNDMAYKSQEAARYAAWERTVWYAPNGDEKTTPSQIDLTNGHLATRTDLEIFNSASQRVLGFTQEPMALAAEDIGQTDIQNNFWRWTHGGERQSMLSAGEQSMQERSNLTNQRTPSTAYAIIDTYNSVMGGIASVVNIFSFGGGDDDYLQVAHPIHNFYSSNVQIPVSMAGSNLGRQPLLSENISALSVNARAAVLADGWVAQSEGHFEEKADDFVLGTMIEKNNVWRTVRTIIGYFEPSFKDVDFSPVNTKPMPDGDVSCNATNGFCKF